MSNFNKHIIIVGSARSGTSWLAETIAKQHRYRLLFEPDHEFQTPKGHLLSDQWITDFEEATAAKAYLHKVFANRVDCDWIAQNSNRKFKRHLWPLVPKKIVVKFVRANLMAKTLEEEFKIPVLKIVRNPYDVLASQMRVKFPWLFNLEHFKNQPKLVAAIKSNFRFDLVSGETYSDIETLTIRWCIENCEINDISAVKKVSYESLRGNVQGFKDLCKAYNLMPVDTIEAQFIKPSTKTHPESHIIVDKKINSDFTPETFEKINTILDIFKINSYPRKLK